MDNQGAKFIVTTFVDTAERLKEQGFVLVSQSGNTWTFLNSSSLPLSFDLQNVAFTNKLNI